MELENKIIVITGAGSGIGRAMAIRFKAEGAKQIVAVDINGENAQATAEMIDGVAMTADVSNEDDIVRVIEETETQIGPIDLFCSNAGVGMGPDLNSPNREWQISWDINVMSHLYAARHLVPRMVARGGGYFLNTASAAGLLNQVGAAAYGVTKHAAIGFGEWLAIHHQHEGIKVSMLCPQAVRTAMAHDYTVIFGDKSGVDFLAEITKIEDRNDCVNGPKVTMRHEECMASYKRGGAAGGTEEEKKTLEKVRAFMAKLVAKK